MASHVNSPATAASVSRGGRCAATIMAIQQARETQLARGTYFRKSARARSSPVTAKFSSNSNAPSVSSPRTVTSICCSAGNLP